MNSHQVAADFAHEIIGDPSVLSAFCKIGPSSPEWNLGFCRSLRGRREIFETERLEIEAAAPGLRILGIEASGVRVSGDGKFDFIYVPFLLDCLHDGRAGRVIARLVSVLKPGGRLLAANFTPDLPDAAYLEARLGWRPCYRDEDRMAELTARIPELSLRGQAIFREDSGGSLFLDLQGV